MATLSDVDLDNMNHPPTKGITEIFDSDVLCGRGGAALRHPGNQTYRRLVNLNKGLYTTCLKTEKLKISRSIVAAIREQKGRFLEKESEGSWYDIGDKKAIEKTSQALREGQPKLRQKIVEMGGVAAMESQYGHPGLYPEQVGLAADPNLMQMPPPPPVIPSHQQQQHPLHQMHIQNQAQQVAVAAAQNAVLRQGQIQSMQQLPHPDARRTSVHEELFKRLSLRDLQVQEEHLQHQQRQQYDRAQIQHPHLQSQQQIYQQQQLYQQQLQQQQQQQQQQMNHSMPPPPDQIHQEQRTSTSEISLLSGMSGGSVPSVPPSGSRRESDKSMDSTLGRMLGNLNQPAPSGPIGSEFYQSQQQRQAHEHQQSLSQFDDSCDDMNISGHYPAPVRSKLEDKLAQDRRRVYARMKYNPGSQYASPTNNNVAKGGLPANSNHSHSMGDGMPDFHMVESSLSLYSNLSTMTDGKSDQPKPSVPGSLANHLRAQPETVKVVDHSALGNNRLDRGSGHSLMSVSSIDSNLFSDFKRGVSAHSIGDISILNKMERPNEEDEDDTDGFSNRLDEGGAIL